MVATSNEGSLARQNPRPRAPSGFSQLNTPQRRGFPSLRLPRRSRGSSRPRVHMARPGTLAQVDDGSEGRGDDNTAHLGGILRDGGKVPSMAGWKRRAAHSTLYRAESTITAKSTSISPIVVVLQSSSSRLPSDSIRARTIGKCAEMFASGGRKYL